MNQTSKNFLRCGLQHKVEIVRERKVHILGLHDEIKSNTNGNITEPKYDYCFIDGGKNWTIDGAAFFMVDKVLRKRMGCFR